MEKWEYLKFESRNNEIININGKDPRKTETWDIFGLSFKSITGGRIDEYQFLNSLGNDGWEIFGLCGTDTGSQAMIARRPRSDS